MVLHRILKKVKGQSRRLYHLLRHSIRKSVKTNSAYYAYDKETFESNPLVCHAGNVGDIIFSCVFLKALWQKTGKSIKFHLQTHVPCEYIVKHPLKNVLMNSKMAEQLKPLLLAQPYIADVTINDDKPKSPYLDLNKFRQLPINFHCHLIQGWQQMCTDLWLNVYDPWISAKKIPGFHNVIVVCRTERLRSEYIDYKFLKEFQKNLLFIGLPNEYHLFLTETHIDCQYQVIDDFDQLASIIHSCRLLISNQGFLYSLAESLQCPRVLESNTISPNNYPMSPSGRIALFQKPFENFVLSMLTQSDDAMRNT